MTKYPWIICYDSTKGDDAYAFECTRCGEKCRFVTPMNIRIWIAAGKEFQKQHKNCEEKAQAEREEA